MKTIIHRTILVVGLACTAAWFPREAHAQESGVAEGRTRFNRGIELYKEGNYHAALAEFRAAYAAAPSFRIHYNLGQTLFQLQDYAGAVQALEQYLSEGADKIDPARKQAVESDLAQLKTRVAMVSLVVNVPDAEVLIDDEPRGNPRQTPLMVSSGRRRISVTASGYETETRVLDIAGKQRLELTFELKPIGGASSGAAEFSSRPKSRAPFYIGLAATGALGAATMVMVSVASSKKSAYDKELDVPNNAKAISDARGTARTTALVADIVGGATLVAASLTVVAFVLTSGEERVPAKRGQSPKPIWRAAVGPASVGVVGTF